jgi:hypothetical protein
MADKTLNDQDVTAQDDPLSAVIAESVARIRSVYELVPDFAPAPPEGMTRMVNARVISDEFVEAAAVTIENDPTLRASTSLDPKKARLVINRNLRFEALAAAAESLARDIRYNMFREREETVTDALQVYSLAKGYARRPRGAALVSHVRTMRETLGRAGIARKAKTQPLAAAS